MLTYKPGAAFDPAAIRKVLDPLKVGVVQFQISAHGRVSEQRGKRIFETGKDRFAVLDSINSPNVPLNTPVLIEGILFDKLKPMEIVVLSAKRQP